VGEGEDYTILKASLASAEVSAGAVAKADQKFSDHSKHLK
jgi:hypothetical protein